MNQQRFVTTTAGGSYDILPNGQEFVMFERRSAAAEVGTPIVIRVDWARWVRRRQPKCRNSSDAHNCGVTSHLSAGHNDRKPPLRPHWLATRRRTRRQRRTHITASLIIGVAASGSERSAILIAGVAGVVAGSMSMAAGEYVSVSSHAALASAGAFAVGAELPVVLSAVAPREWIPRLVTASTILLLIVLGALAARVGGASIGRRAFRVAFWGALAMAASAAVGRLFGTQVAYAICLRQLQAISLACEWRGDADLETVEI